jgi:hypothetical protein
VEADAGKPPPSIKWITSQVLIPIQGMEGSVKSVQYQSEDGRFTIVRYGKMIDKREHGAHGMRKWRFAWMGFKLTDATPEPHQSGVVARRSSLADMKKEAERRAAKKIELDRT